MKASYIDYRDTHSFSATLLSYLDRDPKLSSFISDWPDIKGFVKQMKQKKSHSVDRNLLVRVLKEQYGTLLEGSDAETVRSNIDALSKEQTFTVTTGHQLNVFTGPLYFLFKIVTAIRLADDLQKTYPNQRFVPVFWMATEDHDFDEINHAYLRGEKITWRTEAGGAVGRMSLDTIGEALDAYIGMLGRSEYACVLRDMVVQAYRYHETPAEATRYLTHQLFAKFGLVILDGDHPQLKERFLPIIQQDILRQDSHKIIANTNERLIQQGFSTQVNDRPINFFYLTDTVRSRIVASVDGTFEVLNQDIRFTEADLLREMKDHPERFSPNVVMRPLYQEVLLPNLAYIGGGAEIVYWLQLKDVFDQYDVPFPLLVPRNSAIISNENLQGKMERLGLHMEDLFRPELELKNQYVQSRTTHRLNLKDEWEEVTEIFERIKSRAERIDPTLGPSTAAVHARLEKAVRRLEKKLLKAERRNHQDGLSQLERVKERCFPGGTLQERVENFGTLYIKHGPELIDMLVRHFHPLDYRFTILYSN